MILVGAAANLFSLYVLLAQQQVSACRISPHCFHSKFALVGFIDSELCHIIHIPLSFHIVILYFLIASKLIYI